MLKISIIIPAFNEASIIANTINQIKDRIACKECELIVSVASKTTDSTRDIAHKIACQVIESNQSCRSIQLNEGAAVATGEILYFLHADTIPPVGFDQDIRDTISGGSEAGFFSYRFDSEKRLLKTNSFFTKYDGIFAGGGDQGFFITKEAFKKLNGFDPRFVIMEDFDMIKRVRKNKINYSVIDNPLTVSARKYENNSYLKVNLVNLAAMIMFKLGIAPKKIKSFYTSKLS